SCQRRYHLWNLPQGLSHDSFFDDQDSEDREDCLATFNLVATSLLTGHCGSVLFDYHRPEVDRCISLLRQRFSNAKHQALAASLLEQFQENLFVSLAPNEPFSQGRYLQVVNSLRDKIADHQLTQLEADSIREN